MRWRTFTEADLAGHNAGWDNQALAGGCGPTRMRSASAWTIHKPRVGSHIRRAPSRGASSASIGDRAPVRSETDCPRKCTSRLLGTCGMGQPAHPARRANRNDSRTVRRAMLAVEPDLPVGGVQTFTSFGTPNAASGARRLLTSALPAGSSGVGHHSGAVCDPRLFGCQARSELGVRFALGAAKRQFSRTSCAKDSASLWSARSWPAGAWSARESGQSVVRRLAAACGSFCRGLRAVILAAVRRCISPRARPPP